MSGLSFCAVVGIGKYIEKKEYELKYTRLVCDARIKKNS